MKYLKFLLLCTLAVLSCFAIVSCSGDDEPDSSTDIVGTWSGTRTYYNPASGTKYQYLYLTFYSDGTGELEYEAPGSYSAASFTYSLSGNTVHCQGVYASSADDLASAFDMTLISEDGVLYPAYGGKFSHWVLMRNSGSDIYNSSRNEPANYDKYRIVYDQLAGTSWKILSSTVDGKNNIRNDETNLANVILTFSNIRRSDMTGYMLILVGGLNFGGFWNIDENGALYFCPIMDFSMYSASDAGSLTRIWGIGGTITTLTSDRLIITDGEYKYVFTSVD